MARTSTTPLRPHAGRVLLKGLCVAAPFLAAPFLAAWGPLAQPPTLQDVQVAGRVLHFQEPPFAGEVVVAIVFDQSQPASLVEAHALDALLGAGLAVGNLTLLPRLVEQRQLAGSAGYGAIFLTSGADDQLLAASLRSHRVLCLTRHLEQVEHGACVVAICSEPQVVIVVNETNASAVGLQFATAFRMMVREI